MSEVNLKQWAGNLGATELVVRERHYDALAAQRDELMQARNGLVENNDALHIQLAELRAQRDEGLAREAELQRRLSALEGDGSWGEMALTVKVDTLQQHLAEAQGVIANALSRIEHVRRGSNITSQDAWDACEILESLSSPDCADGEKTE